MHIRSNLIATALVALTVFGAQADPRADDRLQSPYDLLTMDPPPFANLERTLIDGLPGFERRNKYVPFPPHSRADTLRELNRKFIESLGPTNFSASFNLPLDLENAHESVVLEVIEPGSVNEAGLEAVLFVRDQFNARWDESLAADPFLNEAVRRLTAILDRQTNPPALEKDVRKPTAREIEDIAQRNAKALFQTSYGYDPTARPNRALLAQIYLRFANSKIEEFRARLTKRPFSRGSELARAEALFDRLYKVNLKALDLTQLATRGELQYRTNRMVFDRLIQQEISRAELTSRPKPHVALNREKNGPPMDLSAEIARLERDVRTHFYLDLPPERWRIYRKVSTPVGEGHDRKFTLVYDPLRSASRPPPAVDWMNAAGVPAHLVEVAGRADDRLIPVYIPDDSAREEIDRAFAKQDKDLGGVILRYSVLNAISHEATDTFLSRSPKTLEAFTFQPGFLRLQAYRALMVLVQRRKQTWFKTTKSMIQAERLLISTLREQSYDVWFRSLFGDKGENVGVNGFHYLHLLALGLLKSSPSALTARDERAARLGRPPLTFNAGPGFSDAVTQTPRRWKPLTNSVREGENPTSLSFKLNADGLPNQNAPLLLNVESQVPGIVTLFAAKRLDDLAAIEAPRPSDARGLTTIVEVLKSQPLLPTGLLAILSPIQGRLVGIEVRDHGGQPLPETEFEVLQSAWDGGYVLRFRTGAAPDGAKYRAVFADGLRATLPNPILSAADAPQILRALGEANVLATSRRLTELGLSRTGLPLAGVIDAFKKNSYYTSDRAQTVNVAEAASPASYRELSTKDGVFVGNCEAGNMFMRGLLTEPLERQGLNIEDRKVVAIQGKTYHEGDDLHLTLMVRDRQGRRDWFDATPALGPLSKVAATSTSTLAELRARSGNDRSVVDSIKRQVRTWLGGLKRKANDAGDEKPAEPALSPVVSPGQIERSWAGHDLGNAIVDAQRADAIEALRKLDQAYARLGRELEAAGVADLRDQTHPVVRVVRLTRLWLHFAHGRRDLDSSIRALEQSLGIKIDARSTSSDDVLGLVLATLGKQIDHLRADQARPQAPRSKNLLLLGEQLAYELQNTLARPGLRAWPTLAGVLAQSTSPAGTAGASCAAEFAR